MCLSGTKDLVRVGRKWKMINIQFTLRLQKPTETFRKWMKLFAKIDAWVWELLQTCGYIPRDSATNLAEEAAESLEEQRLDAASGQCPKSQRPFGQEVSSRQTHSNTWTSFTFADLAPCDFFLYSKVKSVLKGTIFHQLMRWRQKRHSYWMAWALMSCNTALNNGGHECSGV